MGVDRPATAEGDLGRTPLGHLLVYALDQQLTGAFFFREPSGATHVVQIARGAAVKVRPGERFALLGEMLVEANAVSAATVEEALATTGLLGDVLMLAGRVDRDVLEGVAEQQFVRRMVQLFRMPRETTYRYHDGDEALVEYGGGPAEVDPLALLWSGMRAHGDASLLMMPTLMLLGDAAMRLHPLATTTRFGLTDAEARVIREMEAGPTPMSHLLASGFVPEETLRKLCYTLLITRQIELGTGTLPVGAEETRGGATAVAKMHLRPTAHRVGAAAPDPPGDGERTTSAGRRFTEARAAYQEQIQASTAPGSQRGRSEVAAPRTDRPDFSQHEQTEPGAPGSRRDRAPNSQRDRREAPAPGSRRDRAPGSQREQTEVMAPASRGNRQLTSPHGRLERLEAAAPASRDDRAERGTTQRSPLSEDDPGPPLQPGPGDIFATLPSASPPPASSHLGAAEGTMLSSPGVPRREGGSDDDAVQAQVEPAMRISVRGKPASTGNPEAQVTVLSAPSLFHLAMKRLAERDLDGALEACSMARRAAPGELDYIALSVWIRAQMPGADLKALTVALDEVVALHEDHTEARYYRAILRRRLGDDLGAIRDLRRVIDQVPTHAEAARELSLLEARRPKERGGLFGRLFKR
jgi:hypothetical protein